MPGNRNKNGRKFPANRKENCKKCFKRGGQQNDKNCLKTRWKLCLSNFPANKGKLKLKSARKQG